MTTPIYNSAACTPSNFREKIETNHYVANRSAAAQNTQDGFSSSKASFSECLTRTYYSKGLFSGDTYMEGTVNDKPVKLKLNRQRVGLLGNNANYNGMAGDKSVNISIHGESIKGKIGDKDIDLNFAQQFFGNYTISGKIGDKDISISKGSSVNDAKGENDILALVTSLKGYKFNIKNGQFAKLWLSIQSQHDQNEAMMMDAQMQCSL